MNIFLIQLAILFLPGLIWAQLDAGYVIKEKPSQAEFFIRAFIFGLMTYAVVYVGYGLFGCDFSVLPVSDSDSKKFLTNEFIDEILISLPVSFILAVIWIYSSTYKWLTRFLQMIRATKKFGDEDVWDFMFNSSQAEFEYVHIRDFNKSITYAGWVAAFSETGKLRELLLKDAVIYDCVGQIIEKIPWFYLARDKTDVHIEFPYREQEQLNDKEERNGRQT